MLGKAGTLATLMFLFVAWLLTFAFAGGLRDENGRWKGSLVWGRVRAVLIDFRERWKEFSDLPLHLKARLITLTLLTVSCVALSLANSAVLVAAALPVSVDATSFTDPLRALGAFGLIGTFPALVIWLKNRPEQETPTAIGFAESRDAVFGLPPIINLTGTPLRYGRDTVTDGPRLFSTEQ